MYKVILERWSEKRLRKIETSIDFLVSKALVGVGQWKLKSKKVHEPVLDDNQWAFRATLTFEKLNDMGDADQQWNKLRARLDRIGRHAKFGDAPWILANESDDKPAPSPKVQSAPIATSGTPAIQEVVIPRTIQTIEELKHKFPHELLGKNSDEEIRKHPAFKGIYGREAYIRNILRSIWSFLEADGHRNNHILLHGAPGCAKSHTFLAIEQLFGEGCGLRLNSDSTSKAGIERMVFKDFRNIPLPPFVFIEEIEKTNEQALQVWLSAMDERHEIRKVNYRECLVRKVYVLVMSTANDKLKLDLMMGGRPEQPGPLSSRFKHQFECYRPNPNEMKRILARDINEKGGKMEWIDPAMDLATKMKTDDPRQVLAYLDGGDGLLDGSYQQDTLAIHRIS